MASPSTPFAAISPLILVVDPTTQTQATRPTSQPAPFDATASLNQSSEADRVHWVDRAEATRAKMLVAMALILSLVLITAFGYILIRRVIRQWKMQSSLRERLERPITKTDDLWKISAERLATPGPDDNESDESESKDDPHGH